MVNIKTGQSLAYLLSATFPLIANAATGVSFDFSRVAVSPDSNIVPLTSPHSFNSIHERGYQEFYLDNKDYFYMINFTLGTPAQEIIGVTLDTGSSDLWVSSKSNPYCQEINCEEYGFYDLGASSTWKYNNSKFSIQYGDYTYAKGDWGMDTIHIGDTSVPNFNFAVATDANSSFGVFGIGFDTLETSPTTYINFPGALVANGLINSQAYSLFLNSEEAESGSILFGAVDHSKYTGPFITVPIISKHRTSVYLTGLSSSIDGCDTDLFEHDDTVSIQEELLEEGGLYVLLDSGTTLSFLPAAFVDKIGKTLGATFSEDVGLYTMPCNQPGQTLDFKFSCSTIKTPLSNFLWAAYYDNGSPAYFPNGDPMCFLTIEKTDGIPILGDSFLRAVYAVFDLDNHQVSLAQAKLDPSSISDIEEIQVGPNGVPRASEGVCEAATYTSCGATPSSARSSSSTTSFTITDSLRDVVLSSSEHTLSHVVSITEAHESTLTETICTRHECTDKLYSTTIIPTSVVVEAIYTTETTVSCKTIVHDDTTEVITITYTTVVPCSTSIIETAVPHVPAQVEKSIIPTIYTTETTFSSKTNPNKTTDFTTITSNIIASTLPIAVTSTSSAHFTPSIVPISPNFANSLSSFLPSSIFMAMAIIISVPLLAFC